MSVKLRKASTLIIISAIEANINKYDYKVLLLKRSQKMRAWPGFYVYPGGRIDPSDESTKWLSVLFDTPQTQYVKALTTIKTRFKGLITNNSIGNRFNNNSHELLKLPAELSFRLCSIRETFEETGILLAHQKQNVNNSTAIDYYKQSKLLTSYYDNNLKEWHLRIKHKPEEFMHLFQELNLVPDISGLHEWANWITPINEKIRFDTIFFTCFLPKLPNRMLYNLDYDEIENLEEFSPEEVLAKFEANEIKLIPPQIYEFKRMLKFKQFTKLAQYSQQRQLNGLTQWLPKFNKEFTFGVLPGDSMYDLVEELDERNYEELQAVSNRIENLLVNRTVRPCKKSKFQIVCNLDLDTFQSYN